MKRTTPTKRYRFCRQCNDVLPPLRYFKCFRCQPVLPQEDEWAEFTDVPEVERHVDLFPFRARPTEKACCGCGESKLLDDFGLDSRRRDGHASRCLECKKRESTQYRAMIRQKRAQALRDEAIASGREFYSTEGVE